MKGLTVYERITDYTRWVGPPPGFDRPPLISLAQTAKPSWSHQTPDNCNELVKQYHPNQEQLPS